MRAKQIRWVWPAKGIAPDEFIHASNPQTGEIVQGPARDVMRYVIRWIGEDAKVTIQRGDGMRMVTGQ